MMNNDRFVRDFGDVYSQFPTVDLLDVHRARAEDSDVSARTTPADVPLLDPGAVNVATFFLDDANTGRTIALRTYSPKQWTGRSGALLFAHGGAFCLGDLETDHLRCMSYAQNAGIVVVSVEYALAPENPYPWGLRDCARALDWVFDNHQELGVDPSRVGVGGESAGGALAAALALMDRDSGLRRLSCQMLLYPALDHRQETGSIMAGAAMPAWNSIQTALMWKHYLGQGTSSLNPHGETIPRGDSVPIYASPSLATDVSKLPPALLVTADVDPLRDEGINYGLRMIQSGVPVDLHNYTGTFHVFDMAAPDCGISRRAIKEQVSFLAEHLTPDAG